jgi:hypothetical protein
VLDLNIAALHILKRWRQQRKQIKSKGRQPYYVYSTKMFRSLLRPATGAAD